MLSDSSKAIGFYTQHELSIKKYHYQEDDTLYGLYSVINFDSLTTYDQHQWSQLANSAGIYTQTSSLFLKGGVAAEYWNFQNLGRFRDTTEISLFGDLNFKKKNTLITNQLDANLIGAKNEFFNHFEISQRLNSIRLKGIAHIENKLPEYHQRYSIGNNYETNLVDPELQQRVNLSAQIAMKLGSVLVSGTYSYTVARNNYFFIQDTWRNDTLSTIAFNQLNLRVAYNFRSLYLQPSYTLTINPENFNIIPQHQLQTRLMVKGGLFKAKKLKAYAGVDFALISSYQRIGFSSTTSTFDLSYLSPVMRGYNNLHFFTGFQIDEFKFFVRIENLGSLWNDRNTLQQISYPLASMQFRVGITWDFFN